MPADSGTDRATAGLSSALEAMAGGAFADHVRVVLESLARNLEMLPDSGHRVPRTNWFTQLRAKQEGLLKKQRDQFLAPENGPFMPSFDATNRASQLLMMQPWPRAVISDHHWRHGPSSPLPGQVFNEECLK